MKISLLSPDLSHNCLGRAYLLAKVLQRHYKIEIIGPTFTNDIWEPILFDKSIEYKTVQIRGGVKTYLDLLKLSALITGDVIYAVKPLLPSYGVGIVSRLKTNRPLLLDIDDWQMGFIRQIYGRYSFPTRYKNIFTSAFTAYNIDSYWNNYIGEKLVSLAGRITVSNSFLKNKFGGTLVYHGRNTDDFDPKRFDGTLMKAKYGFKSDHKVIAFLGTPRSHKGIEDLIAAIALIKDQSLILFLVGFEDNDGYAKSLRNIAESHLGSRLKIIGLQPFEALPELLSASDVVVIPQLRNFASVGQLPAKVFDAMAMGKPIIATRVNDLPEILFDCGWIVEPESPPQLAHAIEFVLSHPDQGVSMGKKARQRCIEKFSWNAMGKILVPLITNVVEGK